MNKRGNVENLIHRPKGSPEAKAFSAMGAAAMKKKAEQRKKMKDELSILLKVTLKKGDVIFPEDVMSLEEAEKMNITAQTAINLAMIKRAMMGDVQAAQYIRDTVGEKPTDKVEMDQSLTIESWAKSHEVKL